MPKIILCCVDGSGPSKRALRRAAQRAKAPDTQLVILGVAAHLPPEGHEARVAQVKAVLEEARGLVVAEGVSPKILEVSGDPAETIVQTARDQGADAILLGSVGQGAKPGQLKGAVARKVQDELGAKVDLVD